VVRDLAASYSPFKQKRITERHLTFTLHGYLAAVFKNRLRAELTVETQTDGRRGRPEQIDFAIGRKRHSDGKWSPGTVIEFAVRRKGHPAGADPSCNITEISKLCRAKATHRILLLLDLTANDCGEEIIHKYLDYKRKRGRPIKDAFIRIVYVGANGVTADKMKAQRFAKARRKKRRRSPTR
jgi:hypothetical protein